MDSKTRDDRHSGSRNCSTDITFESIQAAMQEARALMPTDVPDIYVMTYGAERKLREHFKTDEQPMTIGNPSDGFFADRLCGIPFESYPTLRECHERVVELRGKGKKVALVCQ